MEDELKWSDRLELGIPTIDQQHKKLVGYLEILRRYHLTQKETEATQVVMRQLKEYIHKHFSYEERLLNTYNYTALEQHKKSHQQFSRKVDDFHNQFNAGDISVSLDLMEYLDDWIENHILVLDKQYSEYIKSKLREQDIL